MDVAIYLRKSRSDIEAEQHGESETLARHKRTLLELADNRGYNVIKIYPEVVSGDTIAARPVMQQLLADTEQEIYDGVMVMEVERLARGDTIDQGIVAQTFKYSNTKIITPLKIYDPNNEFDEEYFEFGLFMSRREYKTIKRRLQSGRIASIKEGKYVCSKPPYGYNRVKIQGEKGFTLEINHDEAKVVEMIFDLYINGEKLEDGTYKKTGTGLIAKRLNELQFRTRSGNLWSQVTIRDMLINPVYCGKLRWNFRREKKTMRDGQIVVSRPRNTDMIIVDGRHPAIISDEIFAQAQQIINQNHRKPVPERYKVKNPLSGLVYCGGCGKRMQRRPYYQNGRIESLICANPYCNNVSSDLDLVERRIIASLKSWLKSYKLNWKDDNESTALLSTTLRNNIQAVKEKLAQSQGQLNNACVFLERGVYSIDLFEKRKEEISDEIEKYSASLQAMEDEYANINTQHITAEVMIPKLENIIDVYYTLPDAKSKNDLLKEVIEKVVYIRSVGGRWIKDKDNFEITVYPKLPRK